MNTVEPIGFAIKAIWLAVKLSNEFVIERLKLLNRQLGLFEKAAGFAAEVVAFVMKG